MYIPHIITTSSITVILDTPKAMDSSHPNFEKVKDLLTRSAVTDTETLLEMMEPVREFKNAITKSDFYIENDTVLIDIEGHPFRLDEALGEEVLRVYRAAGDLTALTNFVKKLAQNPDKEVHQQLYDFIKVCGLALTLDGDFLAYKNVREDFLDIYTGTMDNSPGKVVEMPRFAVEKNPNRTCAPGLHFAAWGYLKHYGSGQKTVIVKIDPADVVSIPSDYNNMKGRAYKYLILKEVEQPEELKDRPVFDYIGTTLEDEFWDDDFDEEVSDSDLDILDLEFSDDEELTNDDSPYEYKALTTSQISHLEDSGYSEVEIQTLDDEIFRFLGN
jgi:hypothetical protein